MDVHTTTETDITDAKMSWRDSQTFKTMEALRPWLQWAMIGILAIGSLYMYNRDTNADQGVSLRELERKQDLLSKTVEERKAARDAEIRDIKAAGVTMQLFNERTQSMQKQLDVIAADQKEILNRLPIRQP